MPMAKNLRAAEVFFILVSLKDPYPNNAFTISYDAMYKPTAAGNEMNKHKFIDLLCKS